MVSIGVFGPANGESALFFPLLELHYAAEPWFSATLSTYQLKNARVFTGVGEESIIHIRKATKLSCVGRCTNG